MIKQEIRQGSAPPFSCNSIINANQECRWDMNQKKTIDFGPWYASNEYENEYLDTELSLSQYNRGFLFKNGRTSKKKRMRKYKKRSLSQISQHQERQSCFESNSQYMSRDVQSRENESVFKVQLNGMDNTFDQIKIDSVKVHINTEQCKIIPKTTQTVEKKDLELLKQAKTTFLRPLKDKPYYKRNTRVNNQSELNCSFQGDEMNYVITEPSSHSNTRLEVNTCLQRQLNQRRKQELISSSQIDSQLSHKANEDKILRLLTPKRRNSTNYNQVIQNKGETDDQSKNQKIKNKGVRDSQKKLLNQSKDISTQSHSIEENISILNKETKNTNNSSLSSISSTECAKKQEYIGLNAIDASDKKEKQKKQLNSSILSTPVACSPQKMGQLFQISATHYYQDSSIIQQQSSNIERRLKTEDTHQKQNKQIFYKSFLEQEEFRSQSSSIQNNILPSKIINQNKFRASFSPLAPPQESINKNEQLHLSQNHIRVSHYQHPNPSKNNISSQQSTKSNDKGNRMVLREIVIATNNSNREINKFKKNAGLDKDKNWLDHSQIKNSTTLQRKNILQQCLADYKNQRINKIEQQYFLTSQNEISQTNNIIKSNQNNQIPYIISNSLIDRQSLIQPNLNSSQLINDEQFYLTQNNKEESQEIHNSVIYRKALCSRNQITFNNNINTNTNLNNSRRSQECIGENTRSLFRGSQHDIYQKQLGGQFSTQNNKLRRRSCSPKESFGQKENSKFLQRQIIQSNNQKSKNVSELHQQMLITMSQASHNNQQGRFPKINNNPLNFNQQ